jgi:hypothetical protein
VPLPRFANGNLGIAVVVGLQVSTNPVAVGGKFEKWI